MGTETHEPAPGCQCSFVDLSARSSDPLLRLSLLFSLYANKTWIPSSASSCIKQWSDTDDSDCFSVSRVHNILFNVPLLINEIRFSNSLTCLLTRPTTCWGAYLVRLGPVILILITCSWMRSAGFWFSSQLSGFLVHNRQSSPTCHLEKSPIFCWNLWRRQCASLLQATSMIPFSSGGLLA